MIYAASFPGDAITDFRGAYRWLSNFHVAAVFFEGVSYLSTEHAFQAAKALDPAVRRWVGEAPSCREAKNRGGVIALRVDWERVKDGVMYDVCRDKFTRHPDLSARLLATGDRALIEGNTWHDRTWGVCVCARHGLGENRLGSTLMRIRGELRDRP